MTQQLDRVEEKIDKINEHLAKLSALTEVNTKNLEYHILRTNILESRQTKLIWAACLALGLFGGEYLPAIIKLIF